MNLSHFLLKYPYKITWYLIKKFRNTQQIDFLCGNIVDYICFKNVHEFLPEVRIVARNKKVKNELLEYGINAVQYPTYPDVIIMARHLTRKYPHNKIKKVGMRHGAYHFKDFINKDKYNAFDKFFVTSSSEVEDALEKGITSAVAVGFPKIDPVFNGKESEVISNANKLLKLDNKKSTIIFTATWDKKGYAAVDKWYDRLDELTQDYNVLVTVHTWTSKKVIDKIKQTKGVFYIEDKDILPYLVVADLMIGDTSSIIGEFCALDKPIITFKIPLVGRITENTKTLLEDISFRVETFDELKGMLPKALEEKHLHKKQREHYNKIMFDELDGKASQRAAKEIREFIK